MAQITEPNMPIQKTFPALKVRRAVTGLAASLSLALIAYPAAANTGSGPETVVNTAVERTLAALGGNVSATAKALGISRNTIYRRRQGGSGQAG